MAHLLAKLSNDTIRISPLDLKSTNESKPVPQEVLDLLQYGVENDLIRSGICDFIESRQWQTIQAMKDNDIGSYNGFELV